MNSKLIKPVPSVRKAADENLFSGIWIRWGALTSAERVVCANIVLLPVWWAVGIIGDMPIFILAGITLYEWRRYGRLRLKRPNLAVIALFAYYAYGFVDTFLLFFDAYPSIDIPPGIDIGPKSLIMAPLSFSLPYLAWYVQSNNVRVRLEVVLWACSISIIQMLLFWLAVQFFPGSYDNPPRSLYGLMTGKGEFTGSGNANYLHFYEEGRFQFFFNHYGPCATFLGFVGLMALDIKKRIWTVLLIVGCVFLMTLTGTRTIWVAFPIVLFVRFLLTTAKVGGAWFLFALLAIASFVTLSLTPVSDLVFDSYTNTATAVDNVRSRSTDVRSEIYKQTLERIPDKPLFGHKLEGPSVTGEGNAIGSHSFILGSLLYQGGLVGTGLFTTFWASLVIWLYRTRRDRPVSSLLILLLISFNSATLQFTHISRMSILISMMLCKSKKSLK